MMKSTTSALAFTAALVLPTYVSSFAVRHPSKLSSAMASSTAAASTSDFTVAVLGDLHLDPRKMEDYVTGREHWMPLLHNTLHKDNVALVSLGDLGESKNCDHNPNNPSELFAGTTICHEMAAEYLGSFGVPYEVVGGNHGACFFIISQSTYTSVYLSLSTSRCVYLEDTLALMAVPLAFSDLEGIDEFSTDTANLDMFLRTHNKPAPHFSRVIAEKTLLVGLTSTVFRDAEYTSHEVTIDRDQMQWFEQTLKDHSSADGWRLFVFTHAPPNGSGLRVLQENHVVNGCCWLNHSNDKECRKFIELVREHRCIKAWFSGHFHLGQDYQDSITFPTIDPKDGPYPNRGSCVFVQTSVMRGGTSRDTRQQSRLIRGRSDGFDICTVNHKTGGTVRLDATISYSGCNNEVGIYAHEDEAYEHDKFFKVYQPCAGDALHPPDNGLVEYTESFLLDPVDQETVKWWYMDCGRVLGMLNGMLIEYDPSTLAPLGLVVGADELIGKRIGVIDSGIQGCEISDEVGMEGADCADVGEKIAREQAVVMVDEKDGSTIVVQPNEDGSYWRKIVRNKMVRMREVRREKAAKEFAKNFFTKDEAKVISSWGPYTSTSGTAKKTGVSGLTVPGRV